VEKLTRILAVVACIDECEWVVHKAVALARKFGASVDVLLIDSQNAPAFAKLCTALAYEKLTLSSVSNNGEPLRKLIMQRVHASHPDLVIKVPTGAHPLQAWTLDENDWRLANECPAPVMLVRQKPWTNPVRFAAAVDVADDDFAHLARNLVHTAGFLSLGCHGNLDILYCEREQEDDALRMKRAVKLAQLVREYHVGCERIQVFSGSPERILPPLAAARQYDVLVLGAQTRHPTLKSNFGSMTSRMVEATEGDVILVRAAARDASSMFGRPVSVREQRLDEAEEFV
jgi:nucleotide-binding universal stress UspA family protein